MNEQKKERFKIRAAYVAEVVFEISVDTCGSNFLIIYGKHVNGYFCAIPNWKISCEMAEPSDTFFNTEKLKGTGIDLSEEMAKGIAFAIQEYALR